MRAIICRLLHRRRWRYTSRVPYPQASGVAWQWLSSGECLRCQRRWRVRG